MAQRSRRYRRGLLADRLFLAVLVAAVAWALRYWAEDAFERWTGVAIVVAWFVHVAVSSPRRRLRDELGAVDVEAHLHPWARRAVPVVLAAGCVVVVAAALAGQFVAVMVAGSATAFASFDTYGLGTVRSAPGRTTLLVFLGLVVAVLVGAVLVGQFGIAALAILLAGLVWGEFARAGRARETVPAEGPASAER